MYRNFDVSKNCGTVFKQSASGNIFFFQFDCVKRENPRCLEASKILSKVKLNRRCCRLQNNISFTHGHFCSLEYRYYTIRSNKVTDQMRKILPFC